MAKTCKRDEFYLRRMLDARDFFLKKWLSYPLIYPFVSFVQRWLKLSSDNYKATLLNSKIGAFYLPLVFCSGQSHLKTNEPNQTSHHLKNSFCVEKGIHKQTWHIFNKSKGGNSKVNHIVVNLLCKTNVNVDQLFEMSHIYFHLFLYLTPSPVTPTFQSRNLRNEKLNL